MMDIKTDLKKWAASKDPEKLAKKRAKADEVMADAQKAASKYKEAKASELFAKAAKLYNDAGFPTEAERARSLSESYADSAKSTQRVEDFSSPKKMLEKLPPIDTKKIAKAMADKIKGK